QSGLDLLSRPRLRVPRGRPRGRWQRGRRVRMQLTFTRLALPRAALLALLSCAAAFLGSPASAGVLADDRADVLYHRYDGGGITIHGPSVLVRKKFGERFGASANYYVDMVSSASVDVELTASPYEEERTQKS